MVEINNEYKHKRINKSIGIKSMHYCQLLYLFIHSDQTSPKIWHKRVIDLWWLSFCDKTSLPSSNHIWLTECQLHWYFYQHSTMPGGLLVQGSISIRCMYMEYYVYFSHFSLLPSSFIYPLQFSMAFLNEAFPNFYSFEKIT